MGAYAEINDRTIGALTGTRCAGVLGRVPVESIIADRAIRWQKWGYCAPDVKLTAQTYVDNVYSAGSSPDNAVAVLDDFEDQLRLLWGNEFKADSRKLLTPKGSKQRHAVGSKWRIVEDFECLGTCLQHDGETHRAWTQARSSMWRAFFAQQKGHDLYKQIPIQHKIKNLHTCVLPVLQYKVKHFPMSKSRFQDIDAEQRKCYSACARIQPRPDEETMSFIRRRNLQITSLVAQHSKWSSVIANQSVEWHQHLRRNTSGALWTGHLENLRNEVWLQQRREMHPAWKSRTATRAFRGHVASRLAEGYSTAKAWLTQHPLLNKLVSKPPRHRN
eukprot:gnl/MRDRNA2_/MRDRNA2_75497_c0_seq1.p1 gnl/MRDRNA2_/MRDRNA2_75497_c0~~gnl/MRDRNA2_/MRDRNA2_75497_c0_seq1.p1  ORF type:complete len:331 (+),score=52.39 gnl/MRDRNA2_/MRDRNA2_75497_c0_seq1:1030-2022(+)